MAEKEIVGIVEEIEIHGRKKVKTMAVFDTGAKMTSVDVRLAAKAELGPIVRTTRIKNPSFKSQVRRPVVEAKVVVKGRSFEARINIQDREHMAFPVIIGRNIISGNFIVDPKKNIELHEKAAREKDDRRAKA